MSEFLFWFFLILNRFFFRPHQFNKASIDNMIADISRMGAVFKVDYEFEAITTELHQYRLMMYVDKNKI